MDFDDAMRRAQTGTAILRTRKNLLYTFGATRLPYICLSPDEKGRVRVREGEVSADKPRIAVPGEDFPRFFGFGGGTPDFPPWLNKEPGEDESEGENSALMVFLARRIAIPAADYVNECKPARREPGPLDSAAARAMERLDNDNDIRTGVLTVPDPLWNLGVLIYVGSQVARSAPSNVAEHMERRRRQEGGR